MAAVNYLLSGMGWAARAFLYALLGLLILVDMAYCWLKGIKDDE